MADAPSKNLLPVNIRQYLSHLIGNREPLTERHLSKEDLAALRISVHRNMMGGGIEPRPGVIGYGDYGSKPGQFSGFGGGPSNKPFGSVLLDSFTDPKTRMETTLGMAKYYRDENGDLIINDRYNFNASREQINKILKDKSLAGTLMFAYHQNGMPGILNALGNIFGDSESEGGSEVKINLGKMPVGFGGAPAMTILPHNAD